MSETDLVHPLVEVVASHGAHELGTPREVTDEKVVDEDALLLEIRPRPLDGVPFRHQRSDPWFLRSFRLLSGDLGLPELLPVGPEEFLALTDWFDGHQGRVECIAVLDVRDLREDIVHHTVDFLLVPGVVKESTHSTEVERRDHDVVHTVPEEIEIGGVRLYAVARHVDLARQVEQVAVLSDVVSCPDTQTHSRSLEYFEWTLTEIEVDSGELAGHGGIGQREAVYQRLLDDEVTR